MAKTNDNDKRINIDFADENQEQTKETAEEKDNNEKNQTSENQIQDQEVNQEVEGKIAAAEERIKELEDQLLRIKAEFINYKRRVEREQLEIADYIKGEIFKKFLPVLDDFKIMMEKSEKGQNEQSILEGAGIIYDKLRSVMEREGMEKIESLGKEFNPEYHEALIMQPIDRKEQHDKIVEVFQDGYKFKEKLLRPSKVIVGKFEQKSEGEE